MLSQAQINEIREHLGKAQNPVFFFDNDQDGLCSFLLLQKYCGKGRGVPIKSFPSLDKDYFRRVHEFNADYIFVLDKPMVSQGFFEEVKKENIPLVWIDHHDIPDLEIPDFINYYNPLFSENKSNEPITSISFRVSGKNEDLWLGVVGCISDRFLPMFYVEFKKTFPELSVEASDAFQVLYKSQIGKIARLFGFALKDRITNVVKMIKFLMKAKSPYDILEENSSNKTIYDRFNYLFPKYAKFLNKAVTLGKTSGRILFFQYSGDMSVSSDLANELSFLFPKKIIVVIYLTGAKANISVRGKNVREFVLSSIKELNNSTGGGHEDAVGATVRVEDLEAFKKNLEKFSKL